MMNNDGRKDDLDFKDQLEWSDRIVENPSQKITPPRIFVIILQGTSYLPGHHLNLKLDIWRIIAYKMSEIFEVNNFWHNNGNILWWKS